MTTDTATRSNTGGFEDRFRVTRTDGKAISADRRYIVLAYDGSDPHAISALEVYAASIRADNPNMAHDILDALQHPENYPSQHD
jgi:hypothetical protein